MNSNQLEHTIEQLFYNSQKKKLRLYIKKYVVPLCRKLKLLKNVIENLNKWISSWIGRILSIVKVIILPKPKFNSVHIKKAT